MKQQNRNKKGFSGKRTGNRNRSDGRGFGGGNRGDGGFRNNSFGAPREMHKATCSDCKKECEVPFKPTEGKPVYCRDCFQNHKKF